MLSSERATKKVFDDFFAKKFQKIKKMAASGILIIYSGLRRGRAYYIK
jgi:hypothetical protein